MTLLHCKACPDGCHLFFTLFDEGHPSGTGQERTVSIEHEQFCAESFLPFANYLFWSRLMTSPAPQQVEEKSP